MALRLAASTRRILSHSWMSSTRAMSTGSDLTSASKTMTSVYDSIVKLNFVDPSGARRQVPALVGKTIYEICDMHSIDLGPASTGGPVEAVRSDTWTEPLYGEGPTTGYDHILLVGNGSSTVTPMTHAEEKVLKQYWDDDEIFPESRLATQIVVNKDMDGMTVYVPDRLVDDIP
mmetsp:Transcript_8194/g.11704  ORF Transcript_8194/g.11704 Transcript_8194/m.11704 type:complete len:174 (-) Transcript_8194:260-781(-)